MSAPSVTSPSLKRASGDRRRGARPRRRWISYASLGLLILFWQLSGLFLNPLLVSTPSIIVRDWLQIALNGYLFLALAEGFRELLIGLFIGVVVGIGIGVLMGRYAVMDRCLGPFVNFFNATPLIVIIPLLVIWLGITIKARIFFVFVITLWPMLLNTAAGVRNVNRGYTDVGQAFGFDERQLLRSIVLPATVPYMLAGARIAAGLAILGMIIGEFEISFFGVGFLLQSYGASFETGHFFAVVLSTSVFGIVNVTLLKLVERKWFRWIAASAQAG